MSIQVKKRAISRGCVLEFTVESSLVCFRSKVVHRVAEVQGHALYALWPCTFDEVGLPAPVTEGGKLMVVRCHVRRFLKFVNQEKSDWTNQRLGKFLNNYEAKSGPITGWGRFSIIFSV